MVNILVADHDLDSHELVHDILGINFRDLQIDRALNIDTLMAKLKQSEIQYDLILLNPSMPNEKEEDIITQIKMIRPDLLDRTVILGDNSDNVHPDSKYHIPRPFSLDYFGEVIKKVCCRT